MTPKEKAEEFYSEYISIAKFTMEDCRFTYRDYEYDLAIRKTAKWVALKSVDEITNTYEELTPSHYITGYKTAEDFNENLININRQLEARRIQWLVYWQEVRNEIKKL